MLMCSSEIKTRFTLYRKTIIKKKKKEMGIKNKQDDTKITLNISEYVVTRHKSLQNGT